MQRKTHLAALGKLIATLVVALYSVSACLASPMYKVVYAFAGGADGVGPWSGVVLDQKGNLYGTTIHGGMGWGTVFKLKPQPDGTWRERILHSFDNGTDGQQPNGTLVIDATRGLYGTTVLGGAHNAGTAFQMTPGPSGWIFNVLYSFCSQPSCSDGGSVVGGLVLDPAGNLYGNSNVVFELSPSPEGWMESVLYTFCSKPDCVDGRGSFGTLTLDTKGNIFGSTGSGGLYKVGTVFKLRHMPDGSWTERVLHHFGSFPSDGQIPGWEQLAFDGSGNLYGTTEQGGSHACGLVSCGTVFRLTRQPNGHWKESILHNFKPGKGGYAPFAGVVMDSAGNLYGTTAYGGTECDCGVVYKLAPNPDGTWSYSVLHRFHGPEGATPGTGSLTLDSQGNLYGTTIGGGLGYGVVFKISP